MRHRRIVPLRRLMRIIHTTVAKSKFAGLSSALLTTVQPAGFRIVEFDQLQQNSPRNHLVHFRTKLVPLKQRLSLDVFSEGKGELFHEFHDAIGWRCDYEVLFLDALPAERILQTFP